MAHWMASPSHVKAAQEPPKDDSLQMLKFGLSVQKSSISFFLSFGLTSEFVVVPVGVPSGAAVVVVLDVLDVVLVEVVVLVVVEVEPSELVFVDV
jgi:hypothetical protein